MITVALLALAYVVSLLFFVSWAKAHAPDGQEDLVTGFTFAPVNPRDVVEAKPSPAPRPVLTEGLGLAR